MIVGGFLLVAAGLTAIAAPRRALRRAGTRPAARPRRGLARRRPARRPARPHAVRDDAAWSRTLRAGRSRSPRSASLTRRSGSRPRTAVSCRPGTSRPATGRPCSLSHGSGGSRERVAAHIRMLARHGYGVLAYDNPGNGESEGHSNGLGDNAQPAVDAAICSGSPGGPTSTRGGSPVSARSLGAEVLLEAAAREPRLRAVVADGPARPMDAREARDPALPERAFGALLTADAVRGISGMREVAIADRADAAHRAPARAADRGRRRHCGRDPHQPRCIATPPALRRSSGSSRTPATPPAFGPTPRSTSGEPPHSSTGRSVS